jgi:hypothetical protein
MSRSFLKRSPIPEAFFERVMRGPSNPQLHRLEIRSLAARLQLESTAIQQTTPRSSSSIASGKSSIAMGRRPSSCTSSTTLSAASLREMRSSNAAARISFNARRTAVPLATDSASAARSAPSGGVTVGSRSSSSANAARVLSPLEPLEDQRDDCAPRHNVSGRPLPCGLEIDSRWRAGRRASRINPTKHLKSGG